MGAFRRANTWLTGATINAIDTRDGALTYRIIGEEQAIDVYVNPTNAPRTFAGGGRPVLGSATNPPEPRHTGPAVRLGDHQTPSDENATPRRA